MTRGKENAAVPGRATTATTDTEQPSKEPIVNHNRTTVPTTTDSDWSGHNAATAATERPLSAPCSTSWCTVPHDWRDIEERCHLSDPETLIKFTTGRVDEPSSAKVPLEQGDHDDEPRTFVEISVVASYSRAELISFADELQVLAAELRKEARAVAPFLDHLQPVHSLAILRTAAGMSLDDVAYLAGISAAYLAQIENGDAEPTPELVRHISAAIARDLARPAVPIVATAAGFVVRPDSLLMRSICSGDNPAAFADRGRYLVNVGA